MQNIVKEKVKFLVTGFANKTGSPLKMANTDARKHAIAVMKNHVHATTGMNTIAKDLKSSNNVVGAEDYDGQKDNERDEEDWLQLHVSQ